MSEKPDISRRDFLGRSAVMLAAGPVSGLVAGGLKDTIREAVGIPQARWDVVDQGVEPGAMGAAAAVGAVELSRRIVCGDSVVDAFTVSPLKRRTFSAYMLALGAIAGMGGASVVRNCRALESDAEELLTKAAPEEKPIRLYDDGTIFIPHKAHREFLAFGGIPKLFSKNPEPFDSDRVLQGFRGNYDKAGIRSAIDRLQSVRTPPSERIYSVSVEDIYKNKSPYTMLSYSVAEAGLKWRARSVGYGDLPTEKNKPEYLKLAPRAGEVLEGVTLAFQNELHALGLSKEWRVRPVVNSVLRSDGKNGTNSHTRTSSDHSPHMFGRGIDFSIGRFDIINAKTREFFATDYSPQYDSLRNMLTGILGRLLLSLHEKGEFVLTYEPNLDHYHLSVITPTFEDIHPVHPHTPKAKPSPKPKNRHEPKPRRLGNRRDKIRSGRHDTDLRHGKARPRHPHARHRH